MVFDLYYLGSGVANTPDGAPSGHALPCEGNAADTAVRPPLQQT